MTNQAVRAIFENGVFRPLKNVDMPIAEGELVTLHVQSKVTEPHDPLGLAMRVFDGLDAKEISEIEQITLQRRDFFNR